MKERIRMICDAYEEDENFSGVVRVKRGSEVIFERAYGYTHKGLRVLNEPETKFDTASITKLFTAVSILKLIDEEKLHFDDCIHDLLHLRDTAIHQEITIYHLLTHTSGMGDDADEEAGEDYQALWKDRPNYSVKKTTDYLLQFMYKKANFSPGEGCRYNNCAYILLGLIIEKVTGETYRTFVQEEIFDKVGMKQSGFFGMDDVVERAAEHYQSIFDDEENVIGYQKNIYSYPSIGSADAGALSTTFDLDLFMQAIRKGKLLSREMTRELLSPKETYRTYTTVSEKMGYGFQFVVNNETGGVIYIQKDGINAGVSCLMNYYPTEDLTLTILANQNTDVWDLSWEIQALFIGNINEKSQA